MCVQRGYIASYNVGKDYDEDLTMGEHLNFVEQYVKPHLEGVPARKLYRKFLEIEKPVLEFIKRVKDAEYAARATQGKQVKVRNYYSSYTAFYTLVKSFKR